MVATILEPGALPVCGTLLLASRSSAGLAAGAGEHAASTPDVFGLCGSDTPTATRSLNASDPTVELIAEIIRN
jgi:hypothetical protein